MSQQHPKVGIEPGCPDGHSRFNLAIWLNFVRKEWCEHKWKSVLVTAIMLVSVLPALIRGTDVVSDFAFSTLVALVATLFVAMGIVAGERADGSLGFVDSLPIQRWKAAIVRVIAGAVVCVAPILVTAFIVTLSAAVIGNRTAGDVWLSAVGMSGACLSFYFWITAIAIHQPTPLRVGIVGILVLAAWLLLAFLFTRPVGLAHQPVLPPGLVRFIQDLGPLGWMRSGGQIPPVAVEASVLIWQPLVLCTLFVVSVANYGLPRKPSSARAAFRQTTLGAPRRSDKWAIAWLNTTEVLPVAMGGLALMLFLIFGFVLFTNTPRRVFSSADLHALESIELLSHVTFIFGFLWMVVVATTTFVPNLQAALATFWRSRPIDPSEWFWSKFWMGAVIGIGCLHAPAVVAISVERGREWVSPVGELTGYTFILLTHLMVYSVAVLAACLLRNVIHACILGFAIPALLIGIPATKDGLQLFQLGFAQKRVAEVVENGLQEMSLREFDFVPFLLFMLFCAVGCILAAAQVIKRDYSIRQ